MKQREIKYWISLISIVILFSGCEDVIEIDLDEGTPQLAVDAFITDEIKTQSIHLTVTSPYFENASSPRATGATVKLIDELTGQVRNFVDLWNVGIYRWTPTTTDQLVLGNLYTLSIDYDGESYSAQSIFNPVPPIDSISTTFRNAAPPRYPDTGYYASLYAFDLPGRSDFYWIRTYLNGKFNNDPGAILISQDGAFEGDGADGLLFIVPVREGITPIGTVYQEGDQLKVEIMAINDFTFAFLGIAQSQLTNAGLFAEPPVNVPTNIINADSTSEKIPVGWFNIGAVSSKSVVVQP